MISMKRVLVIPSWYPSDENPNIGTFFQEQAWLSRTRYDTRVMVVRRRVWGRRSFHKWVRIRCFGPKLAAAAFACDAQGLPVTTVEFDIADGWDSLSTEVLGAEADLALTVLNENGWLPQLIHCHCAIPAGALGSNIAKKLNIPIVITEHQHIIFDYFNHRDWIAAKAAYASAARVAAVSEFQRQMLLMNGAQTAPIVIGNLVDDQIFPLAGESASGAEIRLLFVGLASPLKDYGTFFRAIGRLRVLANAHVAVKILCQDTPQRREELCARAAAELSGVDVEIVSSATRYEVAGLLAWSKMLVSTSVAETFGVAVCEALMCGRPVVTTASGGVSDFVSSGVNGLVVPIGDADAIAHGILDVTAGGLTASPLDIRNSVIGKYGREAFLQKLSWLYEVS
jgi:glycosyltransferase involved in cell wall biosynthesis